MPKPFQKKIFLLCSFVFLFSILLITPINEGYTAEDGSSFANAMTRTPGNYIEEIPAGKSEIYYKVYCLLDANFSVNISFNSSKYNLSLFLYSSINNLSDSSDTFGNDYQNCSIKCNLTGYYLIKINTIYILGCEFDLNISLVGGYEYPILLIPGFEFVSIISALLIIICVFFLFKRIKVLKNIRSPLSFN
ncbi:MAG: hypothetical protein EAX96_20530 [Candidatus Lokiarchaeota archaeon]|nr:hypothetical protein [Candidatus Lokiarchaeota archaeon]